MRILPAALVVFVLGSTHALGQQPAPPGQFDYYLLTLSWSPEYCHSNPASPECNLGRPLGFTVHGLWPEYKQGGYPEDCSEAPGLANPLAYRDIFPDVSLINHEWSKHGTCSGLSAQQYFDDIRKVFTSIQFPQPFATPTHMQTIDPNQLIQEFAGANPSLKIPDMRVICARGWLVSLEICLSKDLAPMVCAAPTTCTARTIRVAPAVHLAR